MFRLIPHVQRGVWITDSIELTEPIAEGAMGSVWVAYHHLLHTQVAVKFVSDKLGDDTAEAIKRFEHEATVAAKLTSPHVVRTFDNGLTPDGVPYIIMELLHGESLGERLRRLGYIDMVEATMVLTHTALGLTEAHELGVVHRDIKPDNIFLCEADNGFLCKVLDFGIAKQTLLPAMGGLTTDGKLVGTPEYMSPENVLEDRAVDYRADLWSLAVVMYQALTGQLPFGGSTLGQLCLNLVGTTPTKPSQLRADLPPRIDAWFARALNRDAKMRFKSATEMSETFAKLDDHVAFHMVVLNENTERHLSSSHTLRGGQPLGLAGRKNSPLLTGVGIAAAVALLGGGSWLAAQPAAEPIILAQQALAPMVSQVARRAVTRAENGTVGSKPGSPTGVDGSTSQSSQSPTELPRSDDKRVQPGPWRRSTPAHRSKMPTAVGKKSAPPPPAPPPVSPDQKRGRTPGNTGF